MAGADTKGSHLKGLVQGKELIQGLEEAAEKQEEARRMREAEVKKREERNAAAMMQGNAIIGQEGELEEDKAMKQEGVLEEREEELSEREQTEPIRASAAGSSSPPRQPPPPGPATHIHQLPDEVLAKIFVLLSQHRIANLVSVCERWQGVIEDRNLITKLKLEEGTFTTQEALCLVHSAPGLESLELCHRSDTVALLDAVSARYTNLLDLSVHFNDDSVSVTEALKRVFQTNPHITELHLKFISTSENLSFYQELGTVLPNLLKLEFDSGWLSYLELDALIDSLSHNPMEELKACFSPCSEEQIAKLVLFWGSSLRVLELNAAMFTDGDLVQLAGCSELRRLKLFWLSPPSDGLCGLVTLAHLEELCVSLETQIGQENLCHFFSQSRSSFGLRKISLLGWCEVDDRVLISIAASCMQLEELEASGRNVTISGVRELLCCCRKLHNLYIADMHASVANIVPELPQLAPQLRRIRIGSDAMRSLGKATLRRVQVQMPHLRIE